MILVVMGVAGSGKTTLASRLAATLGWRFLDADDLHPPANLEKMAAGQPLGDADRWPWLDLLLEQLRAAAARGQHLVLACSALRRSYRAHLRRAGPLRLVFLDGPDEVIAARLAGRQHFMPPSLLPSQLAALERPRDALVVDLGLDTERQVRLVCRELRLGE